MNTTRKTPYTVRRIEISVLGEVDKDRWASMSKALSRERDAADSITFSGLPVGDEQSDLYMTGDLHSVPAEPGRSPDECFHLVLNFRQMPDSDPPESIVKTSQRLGGIDGILAALCKFLPKIETESVEYQISFDISAEEYIPLHWKSKVGPANRRVKLDKGKRVRLNTTAEGYRLDPPHEGLKTMLLTAPAEGGFFICHISGVVDGVFDRRLPSSVATSGWNAVSKFLRSQP